MTLSGPKVYETPLSFSPHPCSSGRIISIKFTNTDQGGRAEPHGYLFVRICPQQVAQQACVWHICRSRNAFNLLEGLQFW